MADLQLKLKQSAVQQRDFKDQLNKKTKEMSSLHFVIENYLSDKEEALSFAMKSDTAYRKCASELQNERIQREHKSNEITDLQYKLQLKTMELEEVGDSLKSLYAAI